MTDIHSRRRVLAVLAALPAVAAPTLAQAQSPFGLSSLLGRRSSEEEEGAPAGAQHNISSFKTRDWHDYFPDLGVGAIICDVDSRALSFWKPDGTYRIYPTSVPLTDELTRRGYTEVVRKKEAPTWTPTASQRQRDPSLPESVPPGPLNPLGPYALYLGWPAHLIHGTHDTRKIGRPSSSGCFGLYNEQITELYPLVEIGTQVLVL